MVVSHNFLFSPHFDEHIFSDGLVKNHQLQTSIRKSKDFGGREGAYEYNGQDEMFVVFFLRDF